MKLANGNGMSNDGTDWFDLNGDNKFIDEETY